MRNHTRTHYFRDDNDERSVVNTYLLPTGQYVADLVETSRGALELLDLYGYGHSRLAAIADLNAKIEQEGPR